MADPVWFWQRIVSPHMAGLASSLADRQRDVTYVVQELMSADRASLGWQVPDMDRVQVRMAPTAEAVVKLVSEAPENSIHICQGLRGNGLVGVAQKALARRSLRQWVVMETVEDVRWRGILKRLEYRRLVWLWQKRIEGILATGYSTSDWLVARGMPAHEVFPFAYFLPDVKLPSERETPQNGRFRVLYVGQIIERKRIDQLIDALASLGEDQVELTVVGSGPLERELRIKGEAKLGGRITWLGGALQNEIGVMMASADCLVLPSRHDGWGAVVCEAMMAGTPAICSDHCGAAGVIRASGLGGVFVAGDVQALSRLLRREIDRGGPTPKDRSDLARWARCLAANAGADYLDEILQYIRAGGVRPSPPWESAKAAILRTQRPTV